MARRMGTHRSLPDSRGTLPPKFESSRFPYPSGDGLSVGHLHNYVPCDVIGRYKRMAGFNVLHAMGWDAFGLPAENDALLKGLHPKETVPRYAANFKRQLKFAGCAYDWTREINSSSPEYYKWTQWFFLMLYKRGWLPRNRRAMVVRQMPHHPGQRAGRQRMLLAAYRRPVTKKDLEQWYFKITAYADRLIEDLGRIDWPEPIKLMQRNWIGRSEGAELAFPVDRSSPTRKSAFSPRGPTPSSASRSWCSRRSIRWSPRLRRLRSARRSRITSPTRAARPISSGSPRSKRNPGLHRRLCSQPLYRSRHPDLDRRLRPDGLWHRRNHGARRDKTIATSHSPRNIASRSRS